MASLIGTVPSWAGGELHSLEISQNHLLAAQSKNFPRAWISQGDQRSGVEIGAGPVKTLSDDTYERICKTMGWYECATWSILDSSGTQKNRVVGPYPVSAMRSLCGSGGCGGGSGGSYVFMGFIHGSPSAPAESTEPAPSPTPAPPGKSSTVSDPAPTGLGGYAVVHPITGHVCGVIVGNGGGSGVNSSDYMGCPAGSKLIFQTKPSPSGNVAGYHGRDVLYKSGRFYLASGTYLENGIGYDPNGRVWDTGSGETIRAATKVESPSAPVSTSPSSSPSASSVSDSVGSGGSGSTPSPKQTDDTYERICKTMGWYECATWRILDANGIQKNRVVGPYPKSKILKTCRSNLCGGGPGGSVEFIAFVAGSPSAAGSSGDVEAPSSSEPEETATTSDTVNSGETTLDVSSDVSGIYLTVGNAIGKKISVKLGGKWHILEPTRNSVTRAWYPGITEFLQILVYVDRVLKLDSYVKTNGSSTTVESTPSSSEVVEAKPSESQTVSVSPLVALKTTQNSVRVEVSNGIGSRLSARIAGRWYVVEIDKALEILEKSVQPGVKFDVTVYIDGALILSEVVTAGIAESVTEVPVETKQSPAENPSTSSQSQSTSSKAAASGSAPVSVEVGSIGSNIAFTVLNGQGRKISIQVNSRWLVQVPTSQNYYFTISSIQGRDVAIRIYVDGELTGASAVTVGDLTQVSFAQKVSNESPLSASSSGSSSSPAGEATTSPTVKFEVAVTSRNSEIVVSLAGAGGQKVSLKVGGRWFVVYPTGDSEEFNTASIAGESVTIDVYLNGAFFGAFSTIVVD